MSIWKTLTDTLHRSVSQLWNDDELQQLIKAANKQYGHLIGRPVIWIAPSGKRCHGIATEVAVYGDGETWLKVEYFISAYDDPQRQIKMTEVMRMESYLLPDTRGLHWSIENVEALPKAA